MCISIEGKFGQCVLIIIIILIICKNKDKYGAAINKVYRHNVVQGVIINQPATCWTPKLYRRLVEYLWNWISRVWKTQMTLKWHFVQPYWNIFVYLINKSGLGIFNLKYKTINVHEGKITFLVRYLMPNVITALVNTDY